MRILASFALLVALVASTRPSRAQDQTDTPESEAAPQADIAGSYPAPLYQRTQRTYVPQSVALSGPPMVTDYRDGEPVPDGYHAEVRARRGLIAAGSVVFGSLYLLSAYAAALSADSHSESSMGALFIPCIGPFAAMVGNTSSTGNLTLVVDGLGQIAGVSMLIGGLLSPKTVLVRNDLGLTIRPAPIVAGRAGTGLGVVGTF